MKSIDRSIIHATALSLKPYIPAYKMKEIKTYCGLEVYYEPLNGLYLVINNGLFQLNVYRPIGINDFGGSKLPPCSECEIYMILGVGV